MANLEKSRRMALRRDAGSRALATPKTPASGPGHLIAHACFGCRKSFKLAPRLGFARCPNCGDSLHQMGRSFRAPPASDTEQWAKVRALYDAGFRFSSYRGQACTPLPARLSDVAKFIAANQKQPMRVAAPNSSVKVTPDGAAQLNRQRTR